MGNGRCWRHAYATSASAGPSGLRPSCYFSKDIPTRSQHELAVRPLLDEFDQQRDEADRQAKIEGGQQPAAAEDDILEHPFGTGDTGWQRGIEVHFGHLDQVDDGLCATLDREFLTAHPQYFDPTTRGGG